MVKTKIVVYDREQADGFKSMNVNIEPDEILQDFWFRPSEVMAFTSEWDENKELRNDFSLVYFKSGDTFIMNLSVKELEAITA